MNTANKQQQIKNQHKLHDKVPLTYTISRHQ